MDNLEGVRWENRLNMISLEEAVELVNRIDISKFPMNLSVNAKALGGKLDLIVKMSIPGENAQGMCMSPGSQLHLAFNCSMGIAGKPWNKQLVLSWVRTCLMDAVIHELDECITADGERPFDPHKNKEA